MHLQIKFALITLLILFETYLWELLIICKFDMYLFEIN